MHYISCMKHTGLLATVGTRVRALREQRGLSRRQLSELSGVSERFLAQLETGQGNISLTRFADVAEALATSPAELLIGAAPRDGRTPIVALLGLRGAGKSSVGQRLARRRGIDFVEVDQHIEETAGLSLTEIFELHGEGYYRQLQGEVLGRLLADPAPKILATGGSIVSDRDSFARLSQRARTVWLRACAEDHWNRVIQQGDSRPMARNPHAFAELQALLSAREPLYATADHVVDTTGRSIDEVVALLDGILD